MKKTITSVLAFLLLFSTLVANAAPEISYDGTSVIVKGNVEDAQNPVAILIVNPVADGSERNVSEIEAANSTAAYNDILEYIGITTLDDAGSFGNSGYKINLKDSLKSGICAVYINYIGKNELEKLDTFNHINAGELASLVGSFNAQDADYSLILTEGNLDLLSNIGVDKAGYENVFDKTRFHKILKTFAPFLDGKPNEDMSAVANFSTSFGEALAIEELFESEDAFGTLAKYNEKYWSVAIGEEDDFTLLEETVKNTILTEIKTALNTRGKDITDDFLLLTGLAVLKDNVIVKGDAEDFILNYYEAFGLDKDAYLDTKLSDYDRADICSYILEHKDEATTAEGVLKLYNDALDSISGGEEEEEDDYDDKDNGRGGSFGGGSYKPPVVEITPEPAKAANFPFGDVDSTNWAYSYIKRLYEDGVVSGKTSDSFKPDDMITREEFVKIVVEALDIELAGDDSFTDVENGKWYKPYVIAAVNAGLIQGKGDGTFGIGDKLSRQDAAVILSRAMEISLVQEPVFEDKDEISPYALNAISAMAQEGIITGYEDSTFKPKKQISRAECCAIVCRVLDKRGGVI